MAPTAKPFRETMEQFYALTSDLRIDETWLRRELEGLP